MLTRMIVTGKEDIGRLGPAEVTGSGGGIILFRTNEGRGERDLRTAAAEFDQYFASLPTLDELESKLRSKDHDFDHNLQRAADDRFQELLTHVREGLVSRLAAERIRVSKTQAELSAMTGIPQANISRMERPGHKMRIDSARKLAKALGLDDYRVLLP